MDRKTLVEAAIARIEEQSTARQVEAGKRLLSALEGDLKSRQWLQEGIATSDIPSVLAPAVNVIFLSQYAEYPTVWAEIAEAFTAPVSALSGGVQWGGFQFDKSNLIGDHDGDTFVGLGLPGVGEYDEYPAVAFTTEQLAADLRKHGIRLRFSWEAGLATGNFDWIPRSTAFFARAASEQEDVALAKQFVSTAGVINSQFTSIVGDPALDLLALEAAIAQADSTEVDGAPLGATGYRLVVTPALSQTARNVLSITSITEQDGNIEYNRSARTGNVNLTVFNALAAVGNHTTPGAINDAWFLVPEGTVRPAFLEIFLDGYRTPLITIKDSGHMTLGGGAVPVREGNFEVDDVETRGRHVVGAAYMGVPTFVSEGTGSGS